MSRGALNSSALFDGCVGSGLDALVSRNAAEGQIEPQILGVGSGGVADR
jgi:hypothetical protein